MTFRDSWPHEYLVIKKDGQQALRGNLIRGSRGTSLRGSIPACAGEPGCADTARIMASVYPRVCGGTFIKSTIIVTGVGLSPRVRGNLFHGVPSEGPPRSIPACAGEPLECCSRQRHAGVYPRVCGGTLFTHRQGRYLRGLSPRVRGNLWQGPPAEERGWSIPACAGEPPNSMRMDV